MTRGFATIKPECEETFDAIKEAGNLNFVIYEASARDKTISVAKSGKYQNYDEILSQFKDDTPQYAVIDFSYDSPTGSEQRHKLVFITWVPEATSIHDKSYYTSNKDHLYRSLEGLSLHVQASKQAELAHAAILSKFKVL